MIERLHDWLEDGTLSRFGVVVHHHALGYRANAMVVWDLPDAAVERIGHRFGATDFVTLCYRRPRRLPAWRYNLFSMIHGRDRATVLEKVERLAREAGVAPTDYEVLFSVRRFKQRGARYHTPYGGERATAPETATTLRPVLEG
ncbi:siroheme decarboxylase subunit beta [Endothiovibrio diazotrophicus]